MPLSPDEINSLIDQGATDEEILEVAKAKQIAEPFPKDDRWGKAANVAVEMTGVPAIGRVGAASIKGEMPGKMDVAQLALMGGGAGLMGKAGMGIGKIAGALGSSALFGGVGQGVAGPEAAAAGEKLTEAGHPWLGAGVSALPAVAGSLVGPMAANSLLNVGKAAGNLAPIVGGGAEAAGQNLRAAIPTISPAASSIKAAQETGEALSPAAFKAASELEGAFPGLKLRPDQAQFLESGIARTPLKDAAYRAKQSTEALNSVAGQQQALVKGAQGIAGKVAGTAELPGVAGVGSEIQRGVSGRMADAGKRYGAAVAALKNSPDATAAASMWRNEIGRTIDELRQMPEIKLSSGGKGILNDLEQTSKDINNAYEAALFRKELKGLVKSSATRLQAGQGDHTDTIVKRIGDAIDQTMAEQAPRNKKAAPLFQELLDASKDYYGAKFSPGAQLARKVSGVKTPSSVVTRKPEDVIRAIMNSPQNEAAAILERGGIPPEQIRQAAGSALLEKIIRTDPVSGAQSVDVAALKGFWKNIPPSQKQLLFGEQAQAIEKLIKAGSTVTYTGGYQPPTGASLPVLLPWMSKIGGPLGRTVAGVAAQAAQKGEALAAYSGKALTAPPVITPALQAQEAAFRSIPAAIAGARTNKR